MTIEEYQKQAKRTCPSLGTEAMDLAHMVLGIGSEWNEFIDAINKEDKVNIGEELADIMWYLANYCNFRNYSFNDMFNATSNPAVHSFSYYLSKLQDKVKKYLAYGKPIDEELEVLDLKEICRAIQSYYLGENINMEESLDRNINKLKVRYPEKFTEELAINRNIDAELIELSK